MKAFIKRLRAHLSSERDKISYLDAKGRAGYVLRYYWLWILGIGGGFFMLFYILFHAFFSVKDYWFYGIFANTMADAGNGSALWHDFVDETGYNTRQKKVEMNAASYFDPSVQGGANNSYYQMFVALVESGDLDVLVMGTEGLKAVGSSGRLLDLGAAGGEEAEAGTAAVQELMQKYKDRLIYCDPYDEAYSEEPVPVGIDISDSLLVTKYHLYEEGTQVALGLAAYTQRPRSAADFLEFILK